MNKKEKLMFFSYFLAGMIINSITVGLPLFFATSGYTKVETGILTSVLFLGSLAQPLIGYICDITGKKQMIAKCLFVGMGTIAICMTFFQDFYIMIGLSIMLSVFKDPIISLLDDIIIKYINVVGGNYGKIRSGASWGYALGLFSLIPLNFILKNNEVLVPVLTLIVILGVLFIIIQSLLGDITFEVSLEKDVDMIEENNILYKKEIKEKLLSKPYILLVMINLLIMGTSTAKSSYQSILLQNFGAGALFLSVANFVTILPEMILMSRTGQWLKDVSLKKVLYSVIGISAIFNMLIAVSPNSTFLISILWLHGLMMAIFIPTFFVKLRNYLGENVSASGLLINSMSQNLGAFFIGYTMITPIYSNFGFTMLFATASILNLLAIIPTSMLKEEKLLNTKK